MLIPSTEILQNNRINDRNKHTVFFHKSLLFMFLYYRKGLDSKFCVIFVFNFVFKSSVPFFYPNITKKLLMNQISRSNIVFIYAEFFIIINYNFFAVVLNDLCLSFNGLSAKLCCYVVKHSFLFLLIAISD